MSSCELFVFKDDKVNSNKEGDLLVRFNEDVLHTSDVINEFPEGLSGSDSLKLINKIIEEWIGERLLYKEALNNLNIDKQSIEEEVMMFRRELYVHEFQNYYLNQKIDSSFSDQEIEQHYKKHKNNFYLNRDIFKAIFVKFPKDFNKFNEVGKLIKAKDEESLQKLKDIVISYAADYHLEFDEWYYVDQVIDPALLKSDFLAINQLTYRVSGDYQYIAYVSEILKKGELAPIEFVTPRIKTVLSTKSRNKRLEEFKEVLKGKAIAKGELELKK